MAAIGEARVIPVAALPVVQAAQTADEVWGALDREAVSRVEYRWSGYVLATLLACLQEQGVDLMWDHEEASSALSQALAPPTRWPG